MDAVSIILHFFFNRHRTVLMGLTLIFPLALRTKRFGGTNQIPSGLPVIRQALNAKSKSANINCRNIAITLIDPGWWRKRWRLLIGRSTKRGMFTPSKVLLQALIDRGPREFAVPAEDQPPQLSAELL
jgi:hypothetical protein